MSDRLIGKLISELKNAQTELAADAMEFPKQDLFGHGAQCGAYQGLKLALDILEGILQDRNEADLKK